MKFAFNIGNFATVRRMGAAKTRELFSLRKLDLTSLAQGFAAQLAAHLLLALALFSVGVGARGVDWVSSTSSHLASAARAHVDGLLVSWETMLPEWWRGWLFGLLTAALLMDVVALAETRLFGINRWLGSCSLLVPGRVRCWMGQ